MPAKATPTSNQIEFLHEVKAKPLPPYTGVGAQPKLGTVNIVLSSSSQSGVSDNFQGDNKEKLVEQIYLLLVSFLNSRGHHQIAADLLQECEARDWLPKSYNWQGEVVPANFNDFISRDIERGSSLELLLRNIFMIERYNAVNAPKPNLLSLVGKLRGRLRRIRFPLYSKLSEERSATGHLQGWYQTALPWSLNYDLWADSLLSLVASRFSHLKTITGHRLPSYCVIFDRSDRRIITGGDDGIVKIWCARSGFLLYSLRAHSNCISDMSLDASNTFVAVGSIDGYISFWHLSSGKHLFTLNAFSPILTLEFQPMEAPAREVVLMSTCSDGYAKFWAVDLQARSANQTPMKFHCKSLARDEIRCASFSPSGLRFVTGATDGIVRLYTVPKVSDIKANHQPPVLLPYVYYLEDHEGYVNSVHYRSDGTRLVTSSWDGCIREWRYDDKTVWSSIPFDTTVVLGRTMDNVVPGRPRKVTIVTYCCGDKAVVGAVNQTHELIYFSIDRSKPATAFSYHQGEVYILTVNPIDDRIVLSAGCDGRAALWDMEARRRIFEFSLDNTRFLDGGFSQNGMMFCLVDDLGRLSIFGCGVSPSNYDMTPVSQFFPTDWNELVFDSQRNAVDGITQRPADTSPRDVVVSIEKQEYPPLVKTKYAETIPIDGDGTMTDKIREQFLRQYDNEIDLFNRELANTPIGAMPKHTRVRRKRLLYGSDVEEDSPITGLPEIESGDELYQIPDEGSETEAELSIMSPEREDHGEEATSPQGPYNLRRRLPEPSPRPIRSSRRGLISELDDDELYRPSYPNAHIRINPRRRPIITDESSASDDNDCSIVSGPSSWVTSKERKLFPYHPQLFDVVAYFPEGHMKFLEVEKRPEFHQQLPWDHGQVEQVIFGQIITLKFLYGPPTCCELEMVVLGGDKVDEILPSPAFVSHHRKLRIVFYDLEGQADFIVPYCRYRWSVAPENRFKPGEIVRVVFGDDEIYEAKVKKLNVPSGRISTKPWQCYLIEWLILDDPPESLSPWELETILEDDAPQRTPYQCNEHIETEIINTLIDGLEMINRESISIAFRKPVDTSAFTDYLETVVYPMDLSLLMTRLRNGYYRRLESFEWDAKLIYQNAFLYNLPDSEIVQEADQVVQEIIRLVKRAERGTRRLNRQETMGPSRTATVPIRRGGGTEREARAQRRATLDLRQSSSSDPQIVVRQLRGRSVPLITEPITSSPPGGRKRPTPNSIEDNGLEELGIESATSTNRRKSIRTSPRIRITQDRASTSQAWYRGVHFT